MGWMIPKVDLGIGERRFTLFSKITFCEGIKKSTNWLVYDTFELAIKMAWFLWRHYHMTIEHVVPYCSSKLWFQGIGRRAWSDIYSIKFPKIFIYVLLIFNIPSISFSYIGTGLLGLKQYCSCSRTQCIGPLEAGTRGPSVSSQALYYWAIALPIIYVVISIKKSYLVVALNAILAEK